MTTRWPITTILLLILSSPVRAEGVQLVYGGTPEAKSQYRMVMEGSTTVYVGDRTKKSAIKTEMYLTQSVIGVNEGVIELMTKIDSGKINVNGQTTPLPYIGQELKTGMKKNGEVVYADTIVPLDLKSMQLTFPTEPVDVGYEWENKIEPTTQVPVTLTATYKVLGVEKVKGRDCVKIASSVRSQKDSTIKGLSLDVKADGNIYFAHAEGKMMKNDVRSSMNMILKRVVNNVEERIITKMEMNMEMEHLD